MARWGINRMAHRVEPGLYSIGQPNRDSPVFVSAKATVKNSVLGPYATIADDAIVENAIIRNSIVSEGSRVSDALLEDSIVGNNAVVRGAYKRVNIGDSSELEFD